MGRRDDERASRFLYSVGRRRGILLMHVLLCFGLDGEWQTFRHRRNFGDRYGHLVQVS